jgi:glutamine cyclotransferase
MRQWHLLVILAVLIAVLAGGIILASLSLRGGEPSVSPAQTYTYSIVHTYPHSSDAFTEGLAYADGVLYESTGLYGSSTLRKVDLETGTILQEVALPNQFFGEGITLMNDTIVQLTWQEQTAFVYDQATLELKRNFTYAAEGWGLTFDGTRLIMSDGSDKLVFLDPATFQKMRQVQAKDGNASVSSINEIEYVNGYVYANVWKQQRIAVINPQTGIVKAWIDLTGIENSANLNGEDVLNGIAYDSQGDRLFVTGKRWPNLYEIKIERQNSP